MATAFNQGLFLDSPSAVSTIPSVAPGTERQYNGATYIYVQNTSGSTLGQKRGAVLSAASGYGVTPSSLASVDVCVGVCVHEAIPALSYGWLMKKGFCTYVNANGVTAGDRLTLGVDGTVEQVSALSAFPVQIIGKAQSAALSGVSSGIAYISL